MSDSTSKIRENMDLLGAVAGFFILIFIWSMMVTWDRDRNEYLSNNEGFRLMVYILILVPLFFYGLYIFVRGVWNTIWELAATRVQNT